tara:strand:+ start:2322 stop:2570 length:249 start_codon:yes stop_codon:yes gene_type:complete
MSNKLSQEEVALLKGYQQQNNGIIVQLGSIDISIDALEEQHEDLLLKFKNLQKEQNITAKEMEKKYGGGNINLETGEISSIN